MAEVIQCDRCGDILKDSCLAPFDVCIANEDTRVALDIKGSNLEDQDYCDKCHRELTSRAVEAIIRWHRNSKED